VGVIVGDGADGGRRILCNATVAPKLSPKTKIGIFPG